MQVTAYSPTDAFMCRRRTATLSTNGPNILACRPCVRVASVLGSWSLLLLQAACKWHSDPEHGSRWALPTSVVTVGEPRRFSFRPLGGAGGDGMRHV